MSHSHDHEFLDAAQNNDLKWVRHFLEPDAISTVTVNARNELGETALMLAASHGSEEIVGLLLERGADPNLKDDAGRTPLMRAEEKRHAHIAMFLMEAGAFPEWARFRCPCCGYPTLRERRAYDICCLCNWEDDGQDDPHADEVWGGPNKRYSLTEARQNFRTYWVKYHPDNDTRIIQGDSELTVQAKQAMTQAFDAMPGTDEPEQARLWHIVRNCEATLRSEVSRRVHEYEQRLRAKREADAPS